MPVEVVKKGINNSLKEKQENTDKQVELLKEETQKSLKESQENIMKHMIELNKTIQDLKVEVETIKKTQRETTQELETLGKKSGTTEYKRWKRESQVQKIP
jgi:Flp pilus assembly secretin CpaC